MPKNYSDSAVPAFKRQNFANFDGEIYRPNPESVKIYEELNSISEEIERCRKKNCQ